MSKQMITIIGYGAQAKAWAHNLSQSEHPVRVLLRESSSNTEIALANKLQVIRYEDLAQNLDNTFVILTPDHTHEEILETLAQHAPENSRVIYAHGYSVSVKKLNERYPQFSHLLLAPKSISTEIVNSFIARKPIPAIVSFEFSHRPNEDEKFVRELCESLGFTLTVKGSFSEETRADLFSEQSLLCTLLPYGAKLAFDQMTAKGISPEVAYFECWYEMRLIANTLLEKGPLDFFELISPNALIGAAQESNKLISGDLREKFEAIMENIENKGFYQQVDEANVDDIRDKVRKEWENTLLQQMHNKLGDQLLSK